MFIFLLLSLSLAEFDYSKDDFSLFRDFEKAYSKKYITPAERLHRFSVFKNTLREIRFYNNKRKNPSDAHFVINKFADLTTAEMGILPLKNIEVPHTAKSSLKGYEDFNTLPPLPEGDVLPENLSYCGDYVSKNTDHPQVDLCGTTVDQKSCGCCYAAAVANHAQLIYANYTYFKNSSKISKLLFTPQRFIDTIYTDYKFTPPASNKRCCGGNSGLALDGQPTYSLQADYQYDDGLVSYGNNPPCTVRGDQNSKVKIYLRKNSYKTWTTVEKTSHDAKVLAIKKMVHHYGSVLVAVTASNTGFTSYAGGIFTFPQATSDSKPICIEGTVKSDHQVALVGWGVENGKEYFIGRNTWGSWWGEKGYVKISTDVFCGIGEFVGEYTYPQNYVINSGSCVVDPNCESCNTETLECNKCVTGSTKDDRGMCMKPDQYKTYPVTPMSCIADCNTCGSSTLCNLCNEGMALSKDKKKCLASCPDGSYADPTNANMCKDCSNTKCKTCASNPTSGCDSCPTGKVLQSDKKDCIDKCPAGQYADTTNNNLCTACKVNGCVTCTSGPNKCDVCETGKVVSYDRITCVDSCPKNYFVKNGACELCQESYPQPCTDDECKACTTVTPTPVDPSNPSKEGTLEIIVLSVLALIMAVL
ncbi:cysteine protease, putative [Entamoeba invadens IP1]|uniref:Cysteine protease, putative n=1 Tax=Entamoeba invadens IP1 TaxID=370355 RepID=A0A0A1U7L4_ENTIV|nr:cysteine protease, putative [Entamoeba invadens IP1]ELP90334.1 cysteine protease, putative [Entamoeba invadens IP1]|eukprot:XP_004257105.1 cysteine protease, putative [Entamoeba invadens IP1]